MSTPAFTIIQFGPVRAVGLSINAFPGRTDFAALWQKQLFPHAAEITRPEKAAAFGVCRCIPGVTDGSFEYLALLEATADSPLPPGMISLTIPHTDYAAFAVPSLAALGDIWQQAPAVLAAQSTWSSRCGPQGCDCAHYPCFEYHAWDSHLTGRPFIYIPVFRA